MIRKILDWFKPKVNGTNSVLVRDWREQHKQLMAQLKKRGELVLKVRDQAEQLLIKVKTLTVGLEEELERYKKLEVQHEQLVNSLRAELEVANEIQLPMLHTFLGKVQDLQERDANIANLQTASMRLQRQERTLSSEE